MKILGYSLIFTLGIILGVGATLLTIKADEKYGTDAQGTWFMYTFAYRKSIIEAATEFYKKNERWPNDIAEIVESNLLPEWSEVYLPLNAFDAERTKGEYSGSGYVTNSISGIIANSKNAPYIFTRDQGNLVIEISDDRLSLFKKVEISPPAK